MTAQRRYSATATLNHWITALLVLHILGAAWHLFRRGQETPADM